QASILSVWLILVVAYVWIFHIDPPHDEEYGEWLFISLFDRGFSWVCCSVTLTFVVLSFDNPPRTRRRWITAVWALVVICLALVDLHTLLKLNSSRDPTWYRPLWPAQLDHFVFRRLFPAFFILATLLWTEKKLVSRG